MIWSLLLSCGCGETHSSPPVAVPPSRETAASVEHTGVGTTGPRPTADTGPLSGPLTLDDADLHIVPDRDDRFDVSIGARPVHALDMDLDGVNELVAPGKYGTLVFKVRFDQGSEVGGSSAWQVLAGEGMSSMCVADFDGDGNDDLATYSYALFGEETFFVHLSPFPERPAVALQSVKGLTGSDRMSCGDLDGDGVADVIVGHGSTHEVFHGAFVAGETRQADTSFTYTGIGATVAGQAFIVPDLTGDGHPDAYMLTTPRAVLAPGPFPKGTFGEEVGGFSLFPESGGTWGEGVALPAMDGASSEGLIITDRGDQSIQWIRVKDREVMVESWIPDRGLIIRPAGLGDFDEDGVIDLLVDFSWTVEVFRGPLGPGFHAEIGNVVIDGGFVVSAPVDLDGDGHPEMVLGDAGYGLYIFDLDASDFVTPKAESR